MTTAAQDARHHVLTALELPRLDTLSEGQVRGAICVWDGAALTPDTAVDLGPRTKKRLDGTFDWYPRACHRCAGQKAYLWLFTHAHACDTCKAGPDCPYAAAVRTLMREGHR